MIARMHTDHSQHPLMETDVQLLLPLILPAILLSSLSYPLAPRITALSPQTYIYPLIIHCFPELLLLHLDTEDRPDPEIYRTNRTILQITHLSRLWAITVFLELQSRLFRISFYLGRCFELAQYRLGGLSILNFETEWNKQTGTGAGRKQWWDVTAPEEMRYFDLSEMTLDDTPAAWVQAVILYAIAWRLCIVTPLFPAQMGRQGVPWPLDLTTLVGVATGISCFLMEVWSLSSLTSELCKKAIEWDEAPMSEGRADPGIGIHHEAGPRWFVKGVTAFVGIARMLRSAQVVKAALGGYRPPEILPRIPRDG
jgi:hypothetical protein